MTLLSNFGIQAKDYYGATGEGYTDYPTINEASNDGRGAHVCLTSTLSETIAFFRERQRIETPLTERVLQALPTDAFSYQPHIGSLTAGMTAWTIVRCLRVCNELTRHRTAEIEHDPSPSRDVLLAEFSISPTRSRARSLK